MSIDLTALKLIIECIDTGSVHRFKRYRHRGEDRQLIARTGYPLSSSAPHILWSDTLADNVTVRYRLGGDRLFKQSVKQHAARA